MCKNPTTMTLVAALWIPATVPAAPATSTAPAEPPPLVRPNILWITCEDTSPDLGCYGDRYARTPNLDALAERGVRYTHAFSVAGVCAPSRSAIITGMYPTSIGTLHMRCKAVPPPFVSCFTEYLRAAGYYCTNNVKTDYNFDAPFTAWDECSNRAHYRNREPGQPFFAVFNITTTHEGQIRCSDEQFGRHVARIAPGDRHDPLQAVLPPYYPDTPVVRNDWARYYDLVTVMDRQAGDLLGELEEQGLARSTIVFFFSDHGRGLPRAKRWLYDSGMHVPFIVRWPDGRGAGTVCRDLVSFVDLAPTLLSLAGIRAPEHLQGQAFLGAYRSPRPREYVFGARDRMDETYDVIRAARDARWKYIRNLKPGRPYAQYIDYMEQMPTMKEMRRLNKEGTLEGPQRFFFLPEKPPEELYDCQADPHEVRNLAGARDHEEILVRMRQAMDDWMKKSADLGLVPEEELNERARPGGRWAQTAPPVITPARKGNKVSIDCPTLGASIGYTTQEGGKARWRLYSGPITLDQDTRLRAKAVRLGYRPSTETEARFQFNRASTSRPG